MNYGGQPGYGGPPTSYGGAPGSYGQGGYGAPPGGYGPGQGYGAPQPMRSHRYPNLQQQQASSKPLYVIASLCSITAGVLGVWYLTLNGDVLLEPPMFFNAVFLMLFGIIACVLEFDASFKGYAAIRAGIATQCHFITKATGKGMFFIMLGVQSYGVLKDDAGEFLWAAILGGYLFFFGLYLTVQGLVWSLKLHNCVKRMNEGPNSQNKLANIDRLYRQATDQTGTGQEVQGLTISGWAVFAQSAGNQHFQTEDTKAVFNALSAKPVFPAKTSLTSEEVLAWATSNSFVFV